MVIQKMSSFYPRLIFGGDQNTPLPHTYHLKLSNKTSSRLFLKLYL